MKNDYTEAVDNLDLTGGRWVCGQIARMSNEFYKDVTKGESKYLVFPMECLRKLEVQNKTDQLCILSCSKRNLHRTKIFPCGTSSYESKFITIFLSGRLLEQGPMVKVIPK